MFNRKKLYRERLEIYLVYALRANRPFLGLTGVMGLLYSIFLLRLTFAIGSVLLLVSILALLIAIFDPLTIPFVRFLARIATLFKKDF